MATAAECEVVGGDLCLCLTFTRRHHKYTVKHPDLFGGETEVAIQSPERRASQRDAVQRHYENNRERVCARNREHYQRNPEARRGRTLKKYGLTLVDYETLFTNQQGCCAGCGEAWPHTDRKMHVDHDHQTGKVRGLLCVNCNTTLGLVHDNPARLQGLIDYLRKSEGA